MNLLQHKLKLREENTVVKCGEMIKTVWKLKQELDYIRPYEEAIITRKEKDWQSSENQKKKWLLQQKEIQRQNIKMMKLIR